MRIANVLHIDYMCIFFFFGVRSYLTPVVYTINGEYARRAKI